MGIVEFMMVSLLSSSPNVVNTHYIAPLAFETGVTAKCEASTVIATVSSAPTGATFTKYERNGRSEAKVLKELNRRLAPIKSVSSLRVGCVEGGSYIWVSGFSTWTSTASDVSVDVRAVVVNGSVY